MENGNQKAFARADIIDGEIINTGGLTKREYFAAMAMQGFCASGIGTDPSIKQQLLKGGLNPDDEHVRAQAIAIFAVAYADELLKELAPPSDNKQKSEL